MRLNRAQVEPSLHVTVRASELPRTILIESQYIGLNRSEGSTRADVPRLNLSYFDYVIIASMTESVRSL